jgi:hypothetical protein
MAVPSIYSLRDGVGLTVVDFGDIVGRVSLEGADKSPCGCGVGAADAVAGGSLVRAMAKKEGRGRSCTKAPSLKQRAAHSDSEVRRRAERR